MKNKTSRFRSCSAYSFVSQQRENGHSKHGTAVVYEVEKSDSVGDETIGTTSEISQGHRDMSTVFEMRDSNDRREQLIKRLEVYTDSDWASDQTTRKST